MTSWESEGLEDQALCGNDVKVSRLVVTCRLNRLFILLEYFQKYLYLSTLKTTTFLLLLKYFFGQYFVLYFKYFFRQLRNFYLVTIFEYFLHHWEHNNFTELKNFTIA